MRKTNLVLFLFALAVVSTVEAYLLSPTAKRANVLTHRLTNAAPMGCLRHCGQQSRSRVFQTLSQRLAMQGGRLGSVLGNTNSGMKGPGKTVVIVGGGIGGVSVAYDVRHRLPGKQHKVIMVSDKPNFEFTPSNPWIAIRQRKPEDIRVDLATTLPQHGVDFMLGGASKCDPKQGILTIEGGEEVKFDYLIISTGAYLDLDSVPGLKQYSDSVCTTDHASHAADKWDAIVEKGGASCFGPGYEYVMLLNNELRKRGIRDKFKITFVTSEPYIGHLGLGGVGGSREELPTLLKKRNIDSFANTMVDSVTKNAVKVTQLDADGKPKKIDIPADFSMFIPPFKGQPVWSTVPGLAAPNGQILVDEGMKSLKYDNIYAIGTAVKLPAVENTPVPTGAPKTGYMIESMGTSAADNIKSKIEEELKGGDPVDQKIPSLSTLCITDFGDTGGIVLALPQFAPRRIDMHMVSPIVQLAKNSFELYFLHKVRTGDCDPYYEKWLLKLIGLEREVDAQNALHLSSLSEIAKK